MWRTIAVAAIATALMVPVRAFAQDAKVFPLDAGALPEAFKTAPEKLTRALSDSIDGQVVDVSIEDAAGLLECEMYAPGCLDAISARFGAKTIVFGSVAAGSGDVTLTVVLTRYDVGPKRREQSFELMAKDLDGLVVELVTKSRDLLGVQGPQQPSVEPVAPVSEQPPIVSSRKDTSSTGVPLHKWLVLGTGVAVAGVGVGFLFNAQGLKDDVENAPRETRQDFERLVDLEDKGKKRTLIGNGLLVTGGVVALGGMLLLVMHDSEPANTEKTVRVDPVPVRGGAAIFVTWEGM